MSGPDPYTIRRAAPAAGLRGLVTGYADFSARAPGPVAMLEAASPDVVLVIDLADGWRIAQGESDGTFGSFAGGLHDGPTLVGHGGRARGLQVNLSPLGARALLGLPLVELAHRVVALEDLLGPDAARLAERLDALGDPDARFAALDAFLLRRRTTADPLRPDVARAWTRLTETGGALRVGALAAELGCSRRHLAASFTRELGLGPKAYARVLRFGRATELLARGAELGRAAAAAGYADQPHLNAEFRALAGRTPVTFLQDRAAIEA